jgi:hypothetical protein
MTGDNQDDRCSPRDTVADARREAARAEALLAEGFGISFADFKGLWFVATTLLRDVAALNKVEVLPWRGALIHHRVTY